MLRLVGDEDLSLPQKTMAFQILINVAQDQTYIEECISLNAARRILDFLMANVRQDTQDQTGSSARIVEDQKTEEGGTTKVYEVNTQFSGPIQCSLMFLTNLSIVESGQRHVIGEGKTKGAIIENLLGMFNYFKTNTMFDFVANILANVSALQDGRRFMIQ